MTPRAKELYDFMSAYEAAHGYAPTFAEMQRGVGQGSKAGVHRLLCQLRRHGHVVHVAAGWARTWQVAPAGHDLPPLPYGRRSAVFCAVTDETSDEPGGVTQWWRLVDGVWEPTEAPVTNELYAG